MKPKSYVNYIQNIADMINADKNAESLKNEPCEYELQSCSLALSYLINE